MNPQSPSAQHYDVILIGAGHNGLVAAAYLAKAGQRVLVLEQRQALGGAAGMLEAFPGYKVATGGLDAGLFLPEICADLSLEANGLRWLDSPAVVFAPRPDGRSLTLWRDPARSAVEIAVFSERDAQRYPEFLRQVSRFAELLRRMLVITPPSLPELQAGELLPWLGTALKLKTLGDGEMMEFIRLLPMPVADYLDEWFENPALKAAIGAGSVMGNFLGPRASGTVLMLLYHAIQAGQAGFRSSRFVRGGIAALSESLATVARQHRAEICTGLKVDQVILEADRALGVRLADGRQISARVVVSNADPRRTFFDLVGAPSLPVSFVRELKNLRLRASLARVNLALNRLPEFRNGSQPAGLDNLGGRILICPHLDYLERAYDQVKYGRLPSNPALELLIPTLSDPSQAPAGSHIMNINVFYAPYALKDASWDEERAQLYETVVETLAAYASGIREIITHSQVVTPLDLERDLGLTNGDIYHGQMGLDQLLFMRPVPGCSRYRTPIENLYLCGAGTHPGGGISGAPGYNAAREILKDLS